MKKLLTIGLLIALTFGAYAQKQLGLKFGYNSSKVTTAYNNIDNETQKQSIEDLYDDYSSSLGGMNIGLAFNSGGELFSFQLEVAYSQRGVRMLDADKNKSGYRRLNYIDTKPLFHVGYGTDTWKAYAQFGPSLNFWMSKKSYDKDDKFIDESDKWKTETDESKNGSLDWRGELGIVLGAGFKYKVGPGWALINPRYEWGITPKTTHDMGSKGFAEVNRTFSINLGYLYEF